MPYGFHPVGKIVLRWEHDRQRWRQIWGNRKGMCALAPCLECGKEGLFFAGKGTCVDCRLPRYKALRAARGSASLMVRKAIEAGTLPRLDGSIPCVDCGEPAKVYDHRSYAKPLDVDPVCLSCNCLRGPAVETAPLWKKKLRSMRTASPSPSAACLDKAG